MRWESKRPGEVRTYRHDWSAFLGEATITDTSVTVDGVTKDADSNDADSVTVKLSGGTAGSVGTVTMTIETSAGDSETEVFTIAIVDEDEPVSLAEAKEHLRIVDDDSENGLIERLIRSARERIESFTGVLLTRREVVQAFETFGVALELSRRPAVSVLSVDYADENGDAQTYADYVAVLNRNPPRIYPERNGWWPTLDQYGQVTVSYMAGYGPGEAPEDLRQALLMLVAHWYQNREAVNVGNMVSDLPHGVRDLLAGYRRVLV